MPPNFAPAAVPIESADIMAGQPQLNGALTTMNADIIGAPVGGGPGLGPTPASSGSLPGRPSLDLGVENRRRSRCGDECGGVITIVC